MADQNTAAALALARELQAAIDRDDRAKQVEIVKRLVGIRAPMDRQWRELAYVAAGNGEDRLAREAMDLFIESAKGKPAAQLQKVALLGMLGAWNDADALLRTLPPDMPDLAANAYNRGMAALNLGHSEEAREHLERATALRPQSGAAWLALSMAVDFADEPALADRLVAAEKELGKAAPQERIPYCFALGKTHSDRGEHRPAFEAFARGGRKVRSTVSYDYDEDRTNAENAVDGYTAERIAEIADRQTEPTARTIFVCGLPRSGTTLIEQILTSHSTVSNGAETSRLHLLARETGGEAYPALARYTETHGVGPAAQLWDHWLDQMFDTPGRVVEKTVTTSRFLGLPAALLPDAPLVWMTRDPLDRAWSCFRTNFAGAAMPWSYDLEDIAAHFRLEDQLLAQWQHILGDRLLVVSYEALVEDPESGIRRLLQHCGLAEEQGVFAPHENRRAVSTASMVQVRRPINRAGVGTAEPYREFLQPFIDAYQT